MAIIITSGHKNVHYRNPTLPISKFLGTSERRIRRIWVTFCTVKCVGSGSQLSSAFVQVQGSARCTICRNNEVRGLRKSIDVTTRCKLRQLEGPAGTHLQDGWIKNIREHFRRENTWCLISREAKGRMNGHRDRRCQKIARDRRMETIGTRAEYVEEKMEETRA
jgi:hypothetical protein